MKIAIIGYYGHNNLGDELNLLEMMRLIRRQYPLASITVFSGGLPDLYYQVDYPLLLADRMTMDEYRQTLNGFDLLVIGGGGLVFLGVNYFDFLMEGLRVPYIFSRIGIDSSVVSEKVCEELKGVLSKAFDVTVRTTSDKELAKDMLNLSCEAVPEAIWNYEAKGHFYVYAGKKILVSLNAYASDFEAQLLEALTNLHSDNAILTLSMQDNATDFYHNMVSTPSTRFILPEAVSLHKKASFVASSSLVITSRLHAGLVALSHGTPALMLKSTPKVHFILKDLGLESLYVSEHLTKETLEPLLGDVSELRKELLEKARMMKERANTRIIPL
ncbi:MAG: polysaccharide pyruvyl transferase family protein [Clostridia bacterium]|nr:polysaccharide pyruvyl transferase family protein [Clostridia bacterium]